MIDSDGNVVGKVLGLHKPNVPLNIWSLAHPVLGMAVLGCGIARLVQVRRKTTRTVLPVVQTVLGALIVSSLVAFVVWAEPDWHWQPRPLPSGVKEYNGKAVMIRDNPTWLVQMTTWKAASFILGLMVAGSGAAQIIRKP